ncbi:hypothetical protein EYF80_068194 [Liparis tanakae]|uniref:Uncharacterized protein n=1 Tax=Liparis tanakae TaxID=230148 RepID=A0A4Z2DYR8_9TELE|nr:hypothetical protein EYF80_068194 [Liparis tanakae]
MQYLTSPSPQSGFPCGRACASRTSEGLEPISFGRKQQQPAERGGRSSSTLAHQSAAGSRAQGLRVQGSGLRAQGSGLRAQGSGLSSYACFKRGDGDISRAG